MIEARNCGATLVLDLQRNFDFVVLDTPPVLAVSDHFRCWHGRRRHHGGCQPRYAGRACAEALRALREAHAPLAGLVLNKVPSSRSRNYTGGYGYAQGYNRERRYISA